MEKRRKDSVMPLKDQNGQYNQQDVTTGNMSLIENNERNQMTMLK